MVPAFELCGVEADSNFTIMLTCEGSIAKYSIHLLI